MDGFNVAPDFFRWLIAEYLDRRFYEVYGKEQAPKYIAASLMRGSWLNSENGTKKLVLPTTPPSECLKLALQEFEKAKLVAKEQAR